MTEPLHRECSTQGCGSTIPAELETEALCVAHFVLAAEKACTEMRRQAAGAPNAERRTEIKAYVATSAVKLARVGTGNVRLSDEIKKRVLTTFHTLVTLREK